MAAVSPPAADLNPELAGLLRDAGADEADITRLTDALIRTGKAVRTDFELLNTLHDGLLDDQVHTKRRVSCALRVILEYNAMQQKMGGLLTEETVMQAATILDQYATTKDRCYELLRVNEAARAAYDHALGEPERHGWPGGYPIGITTRDYFIKNYEAASPAAGCALLAQVGAIASQDRLVIHPSVVGNDIECLKRCCHFIIIINLEQQLMYVGKDLFVRDVESMHMRDFTTIFAITTNHLKSPTSAGWRPWACASRSPTFVRLNPDGSRMVLDPYVRLPELVGEGDTMWTRLGWLAVATRSLLFGSVRDHVSVSS